MAATPLLDSRPWRLWVVPHTHWDREWYLPLEDFRIRLAAVLDERRLVEGAAAWA